MDSKQNARFKVKISILTFTEKKVRIFVPNQAWNEIVKMKNILKNKYYLYMTEFFYGMSVMAVELGASRLVAP